MRYVSTLDPSFSANFETIFLASQPPVGGLYVPEKIPKFTSVELEQIGDMEYYEVAALVNNKFIDGEIPEDVVLDAMKQTYNFPAPLQKIEAGRYLSWLTKGSMLSYKCYALAPVGPLYGYFLEKHERALLTDNSTTGDTGPSAVAAVQDVPSILSVVKYPKVTPRYQKLQMTTSKAVAIEFDTDFDTILDYQRKLAQDEDVKKAIGGEPGTLNSTNFERIVNEITYYAKNWTDIVEDYGDKVKPIFSVPFGNGSNVCAADYSMAMGIPMSKIIVASNSNNTVARFLQEGKYEPRAKFKTHATAMDITRPNNWKRTVFRYGGILDDASENILKMPTSFDEMRRIFEGVTIDNNGIERGMKRLLNNYGIFVCPHGAVAEESVEYFINKYHPEQPIVSFMTADPAKFFETVTKILGTEPPVPKALKDLENKEQHYHEITREDVLSGRAYDKYKQIVLEAVAESGLF
jgi:threonine synthase